MVRQALKTLIQFEAGGRLAALSETASRSLAIHGLEGEFPGAYGAPVRFAVWNADHVRSAERTLSRVLSHSKDRPCDWSENPRRNDGQTEK